MRAEPVWAYRHLWLVAQQVILDNSSTNCNKIHKFGFVCWCGNRVRGYHQLTIDWRSDVLKGSQSTVGTVAAVEANPGIPEGRYSNPADDQNRPFWCCLHVHTEKLLQTFPSRNTAISVDCVCVDSAHTPTLCGCTEFGVHLMWL